MGKKPIFNAYKQRKFLEYVLVHQITQAEAAERIGVSMNTIKSHMRKHPSFKEKVQSAPEFTEDKQEQFIAMIEDSHQSRTGAASSLGISWYRIQKFMSTHPEYAARVNHAVRVQISAVEDVLYVKAMGGDVSAIRYFLSNRTRHLKEAPENNEIKWLPEGYIELAGPGGGDIKLEIKSDSELHDKVDDLARRLELIRSEM